jgi:hypothetical protein
MPQASSTAVPRIIRRTVTQFEWRHVKGVVAIRALVALWLVALGTIACAKGYWWGALFYVVAGLVGWLAYRMPRWKLALELESGMASAERDEAG